MKRKEKKGPRRGDAGAAMARHQDKSNQEGGGRAHRVSACPGGCIVPLPPPIPLETAGWLADWRVGGLVAGVRLNPSHPSHPSHGAVPTLYAYGPIEPYHLASPYRGLVCTYCRVGCIIHSRPPGSHPMEWAPAACLILTQPDLEPMLMLFVPHSS